MLCFCFFFFFSSRRRHTRFDCDWSSDVCSSNLPTLRQCIPALGQTRLELTPLRKRCLISRARVGEPSELVEQVQLHRQSEEGLVIVLAVDVHEESTEGLENAERGRPAIDMDTVPPRAP